MGTVTGLTAERMLEIEDASIVDGVVDGDNLILTRHDGSTIDAGSVRGPSGLPDGTGVDTSSDQTVNGIKTFAEGIGILEVAVGSVPTPAAGAILFFDSADGVLKFKGLDGIVHAISAT